MSVDMSGLRVVVTAGGTQEPIDPVRVITNRSTGKMGFAFARASHERGAQVTVISSVGAGGLAGVRIVSMSTVESLRLAVLDECQHADILIMAAAVSDFRVAEPATQKIKKSESRFVLELLPVPEFISEIPASVFKVGFAAETEDLIANARTKVAKYGYHLVCANDVSQADSGFGVDTNRITVLSPTGDTIELPLMSKLEAANSVLDLCVPRLKLNRPGIGDRFPVPRDSRGQLA